MPDPNYFMPTGLWGEDYVEAGGLVVPDMLEQRRRDQLYSSTMTDMFGQASDELGASQAMQQQQGQQAEFAQNFVDWPTYQKQPAAGVAPQDAYGDYISAVLPWQLKNMGYSDEEIVREVAEFQRLVPPPAPDYGFVGNLWESAKGGFRGGTRAEQASGNIVANDIDALARLVVEQSSEPSKVAPASDFYKAVGANPAAADDPWEAIKAVASAGAGNLEGLANFGIEQGAQSYPAMVMGLLGGAAGAMIGGPAGARIGGSLGMGMGSASIEVGAGILERIATEAQARGIDPRDAAGLSQMLRDPEVYDRVRNAAVVKGATVGAVDAAIAAVTMGIGQYAMQAAKVGQKLRAGGAAVGGLGVETLGAAGGELLSQGVAGDKLNYVEAALEGIGELAPGAVTLGMGAAIPGRGLRRGAPPPTDIPTLTEEQDFGQDLPAAFANEMQVPTLGPESMVEQIDLGVPGALPPAAMRQTIRGGQIGVTEIPGGAETIDVLPASPDETIDIGVPVPTYDVAEGVEEITIQSPAKIAQEAQRTMQRTLQEQYPPLDINSQSNIAQWLADRGVLLRSKEQMDAIASVVAAPNNLKQAAVADAIDNLATSREANAGNVLDALLALSRTLPPDPAKIVQLTQTQQALAQQLGVTPEIVNRVARSEILQEATAGIEAGVADKLGTRIAKEQAGQNILDTMEEQGVSPQAAAATFWNSTYFNLPAQVQSRFRAMLKEHSGGRSSDLDQVANLDLPDKVGDLQDTERGFVALMQEANNRAGGVSAPTAQQPAAAPSTPTATPRRGLKRGEQPPTANLGDLARSVARLRPSADTATDQADQKRSGGGVPAGQAQAGTAGRGVRGRKATPVSRGGTGAAVVTSAEESPGGIRTISGTRYGAGDVDIANDEALLQERELRRAKADVKEQRRKADTVTLTKEEYEAKYPGRNLDEDMEQLLGSDKREAVAGQFDKFRWQTEIPAEQLSSMQSWTADQILQWIAAQPVSPLARIVATRLREVGIDSVMRVARINAGGLYEVTRLRNNATGQIRRSVDQILIDPHKGDNAETLLHEFIHAATIYTLKYSEDPKDVATRQQFMALFEDVKDATGFTKEDYYGLSNFEEFITEGLTNSEFQKFLNSVEMPNAPKVSVWTAFKALVFKLLGFKPDTAMGQLLDNFERTLKAMPYEHKYRESRAVVKEGLLSSDRLPAAAAAKKKGQSAAPSTAIIGTKNGGRAFIAYRKSKTDPDSSYTLYATVNDSRGDPDSKVAGLTREEAEQYMRDQGADGIIPPIADVYRAPGEPKNSDKRLVGYSNDGDLRAAAFQQKDGTWTYYESTDDVRTDPDAKVHKGLSKDAAQRYITQQGYATEPPVTGAVKPNSEKSTPVGYDPASGFRRQFQDVEATLKNIGDEVEVAATLRNSRAENAWNRNRRKYVEPARAAGERIAVDYGKSSEQVEELLQKLHAAERMPNKIRQMLRGKDPNSPEMKRRIAKAQAEQKVAEKYVNDVRNTSPQYLDAVRQDLSPKIKAMSDATIDLAAQYGLISRDTAENIKAAYDYYVPFQIGERTSVGKAATGSRATGDKTFARMAEQMERTIARGEMNRIRDMVLKLAETSGLINNKTGENPVTVGATPVIRYDPETNSLSEGLDSHIFDENSVDVLRNGERIRMTIEDESLLEALHPYQGPERKTAITALVAVLAQVNRIISIGKTTLSPMFAPFNFFRDIATANINIPKGVSRVEFMKQLVNPTNYASVMYNVAKEAFGGEPAGGYAAAKEAGSFISHRAFINLDKISSEVDTMFRPTTLARLKRFGGRTFDAFSMLSQMSESLPRYAMYKAALNSGKTEAQAAHAAKTASVNFEQRGRTNLSNYWIFGNAKAQGIGTLAKTIQEKGFLSPTIIGATAGLVVLGMLASSLGHEWSEKDKDGVSKYDKIPNFKKDSMLIFKEGALGVPLPQEVSPFYVLGNAVMDSLVGASKATDAASRVFTSFINNMWAGNVPQQEVAGHKARPLEFVLRAMLPSVAAPIADVALNRNTFGSELVSGKEDKLKRGIPLRDMGGANEEQMAVNAAKLAGSMGVDVAPQQIKAVNNYFNPTAEGYAFWRDMFGLREPKYEGDIVNPIVRKFTGQATGFYDQDKFDELLAKSKQAKYLAEKNGISNLDPEQQVLARSAGTLNKVESDIKSLFQGSKLMTQERRALLQERSREMLLDGIRRYNELRDRTIRRQ